MEIQLNTIYTEDCRSGLKKIPDNFVDLIVTDPPYGIKFGKNEGLYNRPKGGILQGYVEVPDYQYEQFSIDWITECFRVLKDHGSIYIVSGDRNLEFILKALRSAGFKVLNHLVWQYQFGVHTKKKFVTSHNLILFAVKNPKSYRFNRYCRFDQFTKTVHGKSANYKDRESVWYVSKEKWIKKITTPTKLPLKLVEKMIQYSSHAGDVILDPFLGSGQTAIAGKGLGLNYLAFEKNPVFSSFAKYRLSQDRYLVGLEEGKLLNLK